MKIKIKDFQILEGMNEFEFERGITVIVGPNASGKSSLFYAIENCLTNPNGVSDCINYNHNKAEVTIEENEESVTWIRTADSSIYKNNRTGQQFVKASKLDSRSIANLGFYFDEKGHVVNIHNEWSVLFPFGESDSEMFRLFEDIFNISSSFQIIDEIKKDEQSLKSQITEKQNQKMVLEERLQTITQIKNKISKEELQKQISSLEDNLQRTSKMREDYNHYSKNALLNAVNLPELFDVSRLYETSYTYESLNNDYLHYLNSKNKAKLAIPKLNINLDFQDTTQLRHIYEQYCIYKANLVDYQNQLKSLSSRKKQLEEAISRIKVCPTCGRPMEE